MADEILEKANLLKEEGNKYLNGMYILKLYPMILQKTL
jgi:hypothetical protein